MKENEFLYRARKIVDREKHHELDEQQAIALALVAIADELHQLNELLVEQQVQHEHDREAQDLRDLYATQRDSLI